MKSLSVRTIACIAFFVCLNSRGFAEDDSMVENARVLEKLRNYDSIYDSGFAVSGTWHHRDVVIPRRLFSM